MTTSVTRDVVRIFIRDCQVDLRIGVFDSEMHKTQPVIINIECEGVPSLPYIDITEKDLTKVINYKPIYHFIRDDLPQIGHIYLLETAAEHIAHFCMRDKRVTSVKIRIEKTTIFPDAAGAGIELFRTRS